MKKIKKTNHGFTLTELIIVIVIIGILAAVLIPTITRYVDRARLSNDRSNARNITMILSLEALEQNVSYFDADYIIATALENGYDLDAKAKGYKYWYDYTNNRLEVLTSEEVIALANAAGASDLLYNPRNKVRQFLGGNYLLIEQGDDEVANAISVITNLLDLAIEEAQTTDQTLVNDKMQELFNSAKNILNNDLIIDEYNPSKCIYINEHGYYTGLTLDTYEYQNILYTAASTFDKIETVSKGKFSSVSNVIISPRTVNLPQTVNFLQIEFSGNNNAIFFPASVSGDDIFKNFIEGINIGSTDTNKTNLVVTTQDQNRAISDVKSEIEQRVAVVNDLSRYSISFNVLSKLNLVPSYNKKLIDLYFSATLFKNTLKLNGQLLNEEQYEVGINVKKDDSNSMFVADGNYKWGYKLNQSIYVKGKNVSDILSNGIFYHDSIYFYNNNEFFTAGSYYSSPIYTVLISESSEEQAVTSYTLSDNSASLSSIKATLDNNPIEIEKFYFINSAGVQIEIIASDCFLNNKKLKYSKEDNEQTYTGDITSLYIKDNKYYIGGTYDSAGYYEVEESESTAYYINGIFLEETDNTFFEYGVYNNGVYKTGVFVNEAGVYATIYNNYLTSYFTKGVLIENVFYAESKVTEGIKYNEQFHKFGDGDDMVKFVEETYLSESLNNNMGLITIDGNSNISILFTDALGNPIMTEGSSFDVKYYSTTAGNFCEVRIFDKYGVLYAVGTLRYNLK